MKKIFKKIKVGQKQDIIKVEESNMKKLKKPEIEKILIEHSLNGEKFKNNKEKLDKQYSAWNTEWKEKWNEDSEYGMPWIFYCGVGHLEMNEVCRNPNETEHDQRFFDWYINPLETLIENAPKINEEMNLFRFVDEKEFRIMKNCYKHKKEYIRKGFTSCTISTNFPETLEMQGYNNGKYMLILKIPAKTDAIYVSDDLPYVDHQEKEIILHRNAVIRIKKIIKISKAKTVIISELN